MGDGPPIIYSARQIGLIRAAGRIVAECLDIARKAIVPGATTRQIDSLISDHIAMRGCRSPFKGYEIRGKPPFPASICASVNDVVVHGLPDDVPLRGGDLVSIDIGVSKDGYIGDSAWTFPVDEPDEAGRRLLEAGEGALGFGMGLMRAGRPLADVARAVQAFSEARGFSLVREFVGHGVGQELHESPQVRNYLEAKDWLGHRVALKPGMVLAIEPMVNERGAAVAMAEPDWPVRTADGGRSVHFEHTVAITDDGIEVLTR